MLYTLLSIPFWIAFWYCVISMMEYYLHTHHMHKNGWLNRLSPNWYKNHQRIHHPAYRDDFESAHPPDNAHIGVTIPWVPTVIMALPFALAIWWFVSPAAAVTLLLMGILHNVTWTAFHSEMHMPTGRFYSKWIIYKYLREYHIDHHDFPKKNFNVVYPFADFIFGTHHRR